MIKFFRYLPCMLDSLDFEDGELTNECQSEHDTQQKFSTFFTKLPQDKWSILDTSSSSFFRDPTANIDFSIMDGQTVVWPHLIQLNFADKKSTGLDILLRLVNSSREKNGYHPPEDISRRIQSTSVNFEFQSLLQQRKSDRGSCVASVGVCVHTRCIGQT